MSRSSAKGTLRRAAAARPAGQQAPAPGAAPSGEAPADEAPADTPASTADGAPVKEIGGPKGPEPTRYGDWERNGICYDF